MRAKRALAFTRSHQLASQDRVESGGRSHDLRLSPAGTTSMLPASLRPAAATRMTTEEPGDQLSSEVRGSRCWTRTIPAYEVTGRSELSRTASSATPPSLQSLKPLRRGRVGSNG